MEAKKYIISLYGCDDSTSFEVELTKEHYELMKKVSLLSIETSKYGCMPTMEIDGVEE